MKKTRILIVFLGLGLLWESIAWYLNLNKESEVSTKLPYLHSVLNSIFQERQLLWQESFATLLNAGTGFVLGAFVGIFIAVIMSYSKLAERVTFPYLILAQMIPVLGLAPIIFGIVRNGDVARIIVSGYITFFPVSVNMLSGLNSVEKEKKDLIFTYAANKFELYRKLLLPAALPGLFSGLKIAAPLSVTAAILVEIMGANSGIGILILRSLYYGSSQAANFWANVMASAWLGILSYILIISIERLFSRWTKIA
ncbi:MAG: ABC transporter permease subunit [Clostridia bacterium]|nr:ABC transporter permease subunit [Clostridia bacterium]